MSSNNLLSISPTMLQFPFKLNSMMSCCIQLTNNTDQFVAFKFKVTYPDKYSVRPNIGIILPGSTCDVVITMAPQTEAPVDMLCKDKFLVQSVLAWDGATAEHIFPEMFEKSHGKVVEEFKMRVFFIPANPPPVVHKEAEEGSSQSLEDGKQSHQRSTFHLDSDKNSSILSSTSTSSVKVFSFLDIERATNGFSESSKIGQGAYGSVYKGYLDNTEVAIKMLDANSKQGSEEFNQELEVLAQMRHPNLVKLIGACFKHHSLVFEFLPNGSLEDCLKNSPRLLTWQIRTRVVYEICMALIFLHSNKPQPLFHGDLKPANILLDGNFNIKLADFGLCRFLPEGTDTKNFHKTKNFQGTEWYIDPDYLETGNLSTGCDVYSFGVTILRILTGASPAHVFRKVYREYYERKSLMKMVDSTAGTWPDHLVEYLACIGLRCCDPEGSSRSELMMEMSSDLKNILDKIGS